MTPDLHPVLGDLVRDGAMATGWCWSPARPRERLRVALLVDGVVVAAAVAARLRLDLLREGVRDGYHGFSLPLPSPMPAATRIEARELASGAVFGRILLDRPADIGAWHARADALGDGLSALHGRLDSRPGDLRAALGALGIALSPRPRHDAVPGLSLARLADPVLSLLLDVAGIPDAIADVRACAMLLRHHAAELAISDDGQGPHGAALASLAGAAYCLETGGPSARANRAASRARGRTLVFLRAGADRLCPSALAALLRRVSPAQAPAAHDPMMHDPAAHDPAAHDAAGRRILAGQPVLSAARRAGLDPTFDAAPAAPGRTGLALLVPQSLFAGLGGLDPALEDGAGLPALDFALRAQAAGHEVLGWTETDTAASAPSPGAAAARRRFSRRWGAHQDERPASKAGLCPDPPKA